MFANRMDYLALPRNPEAWIIENILPAEGSLNIFGYPKCGKSSLALQMADAIGDPKQDMFLGHAIKTHGPVAYVQVDTPRGLWAKQILTHYIPAGKVLNDVWFADALMVPYPFDILRKDCQDWLRTALEALKPVVLIVDTIREVHNGDENDSGHMKNVISTFYEVARPAALIFLSHARKKQENLELDLMSGSRGSNFVSGRMDTVMCVGKDKVMYQSRTMGETHIPVNRTPVLFELADPIGPKIEKLVAANPTMPINALVEMIGREVDLSPEAIRSRVRRLLSRRQTD